MSSSFSQLVIIQNVLTRYGLTTFVIFGDMGLLFNLAVFSQTAHRRNPCSLYLLGISLSGIIGLNCAIIPYIYGLDHPEFYSSIILCKLLFYMRHAPNQMMRTFMMFACIDRYAICTIRGRIRSFSQYKVAIRVIHLTVLFWLVVAIFPSIAQTVQSNVCAVFDTLIFTMYTIEIGLAAIIPLLTMTVFGFLTMCSLKQIRARVQPITNTGTPADLLRKRDRDLMRMLFIEVIVYIVTTIPYTLVLIYMTSTRATVKSRERQQVESFINYFAQYFLPWINNGIPFYIYILTSHSFRHEFKNLFIKLYALVTGKHIQTDETILRVSTRPRH